MIEFIKYARKVRELYLPYVADKFGVPIGKLVDVVCKDHTFRKAKFVDNVLVLDSQDTAPWFETCDTKYNRGTHVHRNQLHDWQVSNQKKDQHISVFGHDGLWTKNAEKTGSVSCSNTWIEPQYLYLELDRKDYNHSLRDALTIYSNFPYREYLSLWHSGNRSVHIEVPASLFGSPLTKQENGAGIGKLYYNLAHRCAGDVRHTNGLVDAWTLPIGEVKEAYEKVYGSITNESHQHIRQSMENIDPNLFRVNSLIRSRWSIHEKTGKQKIPVIKALKENPKPYLLDWSFECYDSVIKKRKHIHVHVNQDEVIEFYSQNVDGFDASYADSNGWVDGCYSPFYEDNNPSVAINIENGWYFDHGNPVDSLSFQEVKERLIDG